jgi:Domain of unknown function (DUF1707)
VSQQRDTASAVIDGRARPDVLASDADRDALAAVLSSAFAEGRLTSAEHADRVRAAYGARTRGELAGLTADLPGPGRDTGWLHALVPDSADRCVLCALLICCPPAGIAWLLANRRCARPSGGSSAEDR